MSLTGIGSGGSGGGGGGSGIVPTGAINGLFTINENGDQVYFSKGNLQYQASTNTWQFAENQWDYTGEENAYINQSYSGWIDLFGWGTGNNPTFSSNHTSDYPTFNDWGNNAIANGGNIESFWRTLIIDELDYVLNYRSTTSGIRYAKAQLNGINGVIILPDDWSSSTYNLSSINTAEASFSSNIISDSQWGGIEQHGAVFLPAAGYRQDGNMVYLIGSCCYYWSASTDSYNGANGIMCFDENLYINNSYPRDYGHSVRLVRDAE